MPEELSPPSPPSARPPEPSRPTPGEVVRPRQRALERPPSERYGPAEAQPVPRGSLPKALAGAVVPAAIGGAFLVLLASPLAVVEPLVLVALLLGLGTGAGTRLGGGSRVPVPRRQAIAVAAAFGAIALAEIVVWQLALGEGGVLPFLDYQWLVFGPVAILQPVAAGLAAWATA